MVRALVCKGIIRPLCIHIFDTTTNKGGSVFGATLRYSEEFDNLELWEKGRIIGTIPTIWLTNNLFS